MPCIPAPACKAALEEASRRWPGRNRASDGICSSATHRRQNPNSDHDNGNAWDLTHDPAHGVDCNRLALLVISDPRVKYVIWNRRIWSSSRSTEGWRPYSGSNPHDKHMHVSILSVARGYTHPWFTLTSEDDPFMALTDDQQRKLAEDVAWIRAQLTHPDTVPADQRHRLSDVMRWTLNELKAIKAKLG